jgi:DNA-binding transcriptional ArsR family regulator
METKQAVLALTALAQESRLRLFRLLVPAGEEGLAAGEIAERLGIAPASLTFHLKELCHAGLIESERDGRSIRYSLCVGKMSELIRFLTEDCCQGRPELCGGSCKPAAKKSARRAAKKGS